MMWGIAYTAIFAIWFVLSIPVTWIAQWDKSDWGMNDLKISFASSEDFWISLIALVVHVNTFFHMICMWVIFSPFALMYFIDYHLLGGKKREADRIRRASEPTPRQKAWMESPIAKELKEKIDKIKQG